MWGEHLSVVLHSSVHNLCTVLQFIYLICVFKKKWVFIKVGRYNWEFLNLSHYLNENISHDDQHENEYTNCHINPLVIYF